MAGGGPIRTNNLARMMFHQSLGKEYAIPRGPTLSVSGTINTATTWENQDVHITGDTIIANDLTVNAGTNILFDGVFKLEVHQSCLFTGTASNRITVKPTPVTNTTGKHWGIWCCKHDNDFNLDPVTASAQINFSFADFEHGDKTLRDNIGHRAFKRAGAVIVNLNGSAANGVTFDNCTFFEMKSRENGGAIYVQDDSFSQTLSITNCSFTNCTASLDGSGGWVGGGFQSSHPSVVTLSNNTFTNCVAGSDWIDAAIGVDSSTDKILTSGVNHNLYNGATIEFTGGTPPAPLALNTKYFVIRTGSQEFKIAATLADAMAGTAINLTNNGSSPLVTANQDWNIFDLQASITVT